MTLKLNLRWLACKKNQFKKNAQFLTKKGRVAKIERPLYRKYADPNWNLSDNPPNQHGDVRARSQLLAYSHNCETAHGKCFHDIQLSFSRSVPTGLLLPGFGTSLLGSRYARRTTYL